MKALVRRACGHEEKVKIYNGTLTSELIIARESQKKCKACGNKPKV